MQDVEQAVQYSVECNNDQQWWAGSQAGNCSAECRPGCCGAITVSTYCAAILTLVHTSWLPTGTPLEVPPLVRP